jgi:hypothetical protein
MSRPEGISGGVAPSDQPPDLTALQATDALLDRVAARSATPQDLQDPLIAMLASLAGEVEADPRVAHRADPASLPWPGPGGPADVACGHADGVFPPQVSPTGRAGAHRRVAAGSWVSRLNWQQTANVVGAGTARVVRVGPIVATAASVLIAFGIGAAITGDPMRPIGGIISLISPQSPAPVSVTWVEQTLSEARAAASSGQVQRAQVLLHQAEVKVDGVPQEDAKRRLKAQIAALRKVTGTGQTPSVPLITAGPPPGVGAVSPTLVPTDTPTATDTPVDSASPTPTDSVPPTETTPPTDTPAPTDTETVSSTTDPAPTP